MSSPFEKTPKQREVCDILNHYTHGLIYGGSRSGKTTIAVRNIILRALKRTSRHLICRHRFNHVKTSIWYDTFPKVATMCFPGVQFKYNKADWFISIPNQMGGVSQIWFGGIDDKERVEKILGNEYSTIYANECSQISYEAITTLRTRLAENSRLKLKFYYDLNPCGKKHWSYQEFILGLKPGTEEDHSLNTKAIIVNPFDNKDNLPVEYFDILDSLPLRQKQRFKDGLYLDDVEGALWTDLMVSQARTKSFSEVTKTVIAVDPAVTNNPNSDETGIVVCSLDDFEEGLIEEDLSGKFSTRTWAQRVVNAFYEYDANEVIAETNNGGDLVEDAIKNIDENVPVKQVKASKGKFARAEPVSQLYELGKVAHLKRMPKLEAEQTEWVPMNTKESPNRIDALTWGLTWLMLRSNTRLIRATTIHDNSGR